MKKTLQRYAILINNKQISIIEHISSFSDTLSGQQMVLARYIVQNSDTAAFMNSVQLSEAAGVSNPTVIRLAAKLGFSGFPEFQKALQETIREQIRSLDRYTSVQNGLEETLSQRVLSLEFHVLSEMKRRLNEKSLQKAVDLLSHKKRIYVVGFQIGRAHV